MIYQDTILKASYYREYIIQNFIKNGTKLDNGLISDKLKEIDMYLSIYKNNNVNTNSNFDIKKFNKDMYMIYKDLVILYTILYNTSLEDYNSLEAFANSYTNDLLTKANSCKSKANVAASITALGKTLSVITNKELNDSYKESGTYVLRLGSISTMSSNKLAFVIEGENLTLSEVTLKLIDSTGNKMACTPYAFNNDTITIPGTKKHKCYIATQNNDEISSGKVLMSVKDFVPKDSCTYDIYAGQNKMKFKNTNLSENKYLDYLNATDFLTTYNGNYSFYIYNDNSNNNEIKTSFSSSKPFSWCNFIQTNTEALNNKEFISFDCADRIVLNFSTNGKIFCEKEEGLISGSNLYYPIKTYLTDFYIVENIPGDTIEYEAIIEIKPKSGVTQKIEYAAIKELKS